MRHFCVFNAGRGSSKERHSMIFWRYGKIHSRCIKHYGRRIPDMLLTMAESLGLVYYLTRGVS
jgi:hypothetical protein